MKADMVDRRQAPPKHRYRPARQRHTNGWRTPWSTIAASLIILLGVSVFLYPHVASWFSQREQSRVIKLAQFSDSDNSDEPDEYFSAELERAKAYNDALASGAVFEANMNVPTGQGTTQEDTLRYDDILTTSDVGVMGRLQYNALSIDLPIYHGTDEETLLRGVGHLEGTSLPIGGTGTRSVLTAHRGLAESTLFNDLDKARNGDIFTISVLDQVLSYRVIDIRTIRPDDTEVLFPDPGKDLVTLVTCTPLGINTHRILVTAERVVPVPADHLESIGKPPEIPGFPWWAVILGSTVVFLTVYVVRTGYQSSPNQPQVRNSPQP